MKSIHEHIEIDVRPGGRVPRRFRWEQRTYRVHRLLDYWILQTRWWGREEKRIYYRLETHRGIVEIYRAAEWRPSAERGRSVAEPAFFPIEGDTHTRERRLTDAAYRPDIRIDQIQQVDQTSPEEGGQMDMGGSAGSDREAGPRARWILSKIVD